MPDRNGGSAALGGWVGGAAIGGRAGVTRRGPRDGEVPPEPLAGVRPLGTLLDPDVRDHRQADEQRRVLGLPPTRSIRTGSRWTTFTKLPVAFCGGSSDQRWPRPGAEAGDPAPEDPPG